MRLKTSEGDDEESTYVDLKVDDVSHVCGLLGIRSDELEFLLQKIFIPIVREISKREVEKLNPLNDPEIRNALNLTLETRKEEHHEQ